MEKALTITIDIALAGAILALPIPIVPRLLIAIMQYALRHWSHSARGLWLLLRRPRSSLVLSSALPGLVLSDDETGLEMDNSGLGLVDLGHQVQENPEEPLSPELIVSYLLTHPIDHKQATYIMTALKQSSGDWWVSANKIRDAVGGNDTTIKAWVRDLRPPPPTQGSQGRWERNKHGDLVKVR